MLFGIVLWCGCMTLIRPTLATLAKGLCGWLVVAVIAGVLFVI